MTPSEWPIDDGQRHCDLCHFGTPDVYADGCCCCYVHKKHGGGFTDKTVLRSEER